MPQWDETQWDETQWDGTLTDGPLRQMCEAHLRGLTDPNATCMPDDRSMSRPSPAAELGLRHGDSILVTCKSCMTTGS